MTTATIRKQVHAVTYRPRHAAKTPWWQADVLVIAATNAGDFWDEASQLLAVFFCALLLTVIDGLIALALWQVSPVLAAVAFFGFGALVALLVLKMRRPADD